MRYAKGTLVVSRERDIPLLRQVRNSKFITHSQLFEFMRVGGFDHDRDSFNWRLRRLVKSAHLVACPEVNGAGSAVYRITKKGLNLLEHYGEYATALSSSTEHLPHPSSAFHAIELNEINLSLARKNVLASWQWDIEIASFNTISPCPFQKDYDAIVAVWLGDRQARFALEYERSLKKARDYDKIRVALEAEQEIDCILYLTSGPEVMVSLIQALGSVGKKVAFAPARSFEATLLDTSVVCPGSAPEVFRELLETRCA
jgi:hypothetical protein